jgi:hypothetical protein
LARPKEWSGDDDPLPAGSLAAGGGSGNIGGMEARVAALEADMKEVKSDLKAMRADMSLMQKDVAYIRGRLDSMPTSIQLLGFVIAIFVAAGLTRYFGA